MRELRTWRRSAAAMRVIEILIDDLDGVLDEINTLIEVQGTLQDVTRGFLFNTRNCVLSGPENKDTD